jgi:hypothetical protein
MDNWTPEKEEKFLKKLVATGGNVSAACRVIGAARSTAYDHKKNDTEFAKKWQEAVDQGIDALEQEARRRAFIGVKKKVFYKGQKIDEIREFSDTLLIFILKALRPEKYVERQEITGRGGKDLIPSEITHKIDKFWGDDDQ